MTGPACVGTGRRRSRRPRGRRRGTRSARDVRDRTRSSAVGAPVFDRSGSVSCSAAPLAASSATRPPVRRWRPSVMPREPRRSGPQVARGQPAQVERRGAGELAHRRRAGPAAMRCSSGGTSAVMAATSVAALVATSARTSFQRRPERPSRPTAHLPRMPVPAPRTVTIASGSPPAARELLADVVDVDVDRPRVAVRVVAERRAQQLAAGQQAPVGVEQGARAPRTPSTSARAASSPAAAVRAPGRLRSRRRAAPRGRAARAGCGAAQRAPGCAARRRPTGLVTKSSAPASSAMHDVRLAVARGQDEDVQVGAREAQAPADLDAVRAGAEPEVEDQQVERAGGERVERGRRRPPRRRVAVGDERPAMTSRSSSSSSTSRSSPTWDGAPWA